MIKKDQLLLVFTYYSLYLFSTRLKILNLLLIFQSMLQVLAILYLQGVPLRHHHQ